MKSKSGRKVTSSGATKGKDQASARLNRDVQAQLGDQLRQMYNDLVGEGVPDKFVDLLANLEKGGDGKDSAK